MAGPAATTPVARLTVSFDRSSRDSRRSVHVGTPKKSRAASRNTCKANSTKATNNNKTGGAAAATSPLYRKTRRGKRAPRGRGQPKDEQARSSRETRAHAEEKFDAEQAEAYLARRYLETMLSCDKPCREGHRRDSQHKDAKPPSFQSMFREAWIKHKKKEQLAATP